MGPASRATPQGREGSNPRATRRRVRFPGGDAPRHVRRLCGLASSERRLRIQGCPPRAIRGRLGTEARSRGTRALPACSVRTLPAVAPTTSPRARAPARLEPPRSGSGAPKTDRRRRSRRQAILMWPCITIMNMQKSVYGPRLAVRGSVIALPELSTFVAGVCPGLCVHIPSLPLRYQ